MKKSILAMMLTTSVLYSYEKEQFIGDWQTSNTMDFKNENSYMILDNNIKYNKDNTYESISILKSYTNNEELIVGYLSVISWGIWNVENDKLTITKKMFYVENKQRNDDRNQTTKEENLNTIKELFTTDKESGIFQLDLVSKNIIIEEKTKYKRVMNFKILSGEIKQFLEELNEEQKQFKLFEFYEKIGFMIELEKEETSEKNEEEEQLKKLEYYEYYENLGIVMKSEREYPSFSERMKKRFEEIYKKFIRFFKSF